MKPRILVVEDDRPLARVLRDNLAFEGFDVEGADDGVSAVAKVRSFAPDLIVLDIMLPDTNGFDLFGVLRQGGRVPIIILTARGQKTDKLRGLNLGADDYITKPLSFPELTARVEAALRRSATASPERQRRLQHRDLIVDLDDHKARLRGDELRLTPTEFRLLAYLVEHAGQLVTHRQVLGAVWGAGYDVDVHLLRMTIRNLRLKLDSAAPGESYIATEYGLGYRLTGPARPEPP